MRVLIAALGALAVIAAPAQADVFTVRGIEVDETAATGADSRELAIASGQLQAARRLFTRLIREDDLAAAPPLDAAGAARLVAGFQVDEERIVGGNRYIGRLTVEFDPGAVRNLFEAYGVPYVLSAARPAVVAPVWRDGGQARLWQENPWLEAWQVAGTADELVPVIAPSGDFGDLSAVNAEQAVVVNAAALENLARNYGAVRVLVALAEPAGTAEDGAAPLVSVRLVGVDFTRNAEVTNYGVVGVGEMVDLARQSAGMLQEDWKRQVFVGEPYLSDLRVSVLFDSMQQWWELQDIIGGEPLVQEPRLEALTNDGAYMLIRHRGRLEQLELVLRERGASLRQTQGGWIIAADGPADAFAP